MSRIWLKYVAKHIEAFAITAGNQKKGEVFVNLSYKDDICRLTEKLLLMVV
jgi:hypothetical protein